MLQDLRFAFRMIRSHPWFSAAIVLTLALGIGVNTTIFTLVNAVLIKPIPFADGDRIVAVTHTNPSQEITRQSISLPDYREYRQQSTSFEALEAVWTNSASFSEQGQTPEQYSMAYVTPGFLEMLGVDAIEGRRFSPQDAEPGSASVAVISYNIWRDRYALSPDAVGRTVRINQQPATIVGVMPEKFGFPSAQQLWMPLIPTPENDVRSAKVLLMVGKRNPGVSIPAAKAELNVIATQLAAAYPENDKGIQANVLTFHDLQNDGEIRIMFYLMLGAVGFVLLVACANVANMMLSRALGRTREMSVRAALGASRWQLIRQLLVESALLSFAGGAIGLLMAYYGVQGFDLAVASLGKPSWVLFTFDYRVFGYVTALCLLSTLMFGLAPSLQATRVELNRALVEGSRGSGSKRGGYLSGALVVLQFTLAMVLLASAGLFVREFLTSTGVNAGLPQDQILTARLNLPQDGYPEIGDRERFYDQLLTRLNSNGGVTMAAIAGGAPGTGGPEFPLQREGDPEVEAVNRPTATQNTISPGFFEAIDLPLLEGRDFDDRDGLEGQKNTVVNRAFAARFWPGESALGKRFRLYEADGFGEWFTIVGVSGDIVQQINREQLDPVYFLPYRGRGNSQMTILIRTPGDPLSAVPALRGEVQTLNAELALDEVRTLAQQMENSFWYLQVFGTIFAVFALVGLILASVGVYAVVAQSTGRRTREIGVRMALGATRANILGLVVSRGAKQVALGMVLGLAGALAATRLMGSLLFSVSPQDPTVFLTVSLLLASVGLLACWLPARRAAALNPVDALRDE